MSPDQRTTIRRKSLATPDVVRRFPSGQGSFVDLGSLAVGRAILEPGWRWSLHIKPNVGTPSCRVHHLHVLLSGRLAAQMDGGEVELFEPMDVMDIPPGHDAWVVGDETVEILDIAGNAADFGLPVAPSRTVGTMLMTDIVDSTGIVSRIGDAAWRQRLAEHDRVVRHQIERFGGREITTTGDGFLALFASAGAALRAAVGARDATAAIGLPIRAGVHTGEVEQVDDDIRGVAVHATARVMSAAAADEVLTSVVTRSLAEGLPYRFVEAGTHDLKGIAAPMQLFSVEA